MSATGVGAVSPNKLLFDVCAGAIPKGEGFADSFLAPPKSEPLGAVEFPKRPMGLSAPGAGSP